ncbi:hypothetical protein RSOLAG1IB_11566 [Rhizoctonia solani AG-1 IB]|uniref:Uncharacterized protein n=1 Tax=Thanatephorus cucumeris (strain AG1-IB / isolate 7/3/14) TaxID=1108050 RepID=A0A0B7FAW4_THACB|nr:hypothetical protein RSOLAG1IB_11566 [Rhizoctonia solani AG-1 IB]
MLNPTPQQVCLQSACLIVNLLFPTTAVGSHLASVQHNASAAMYTAEEIKRAKEKAKKASLFNAKIKSNWINSALSPNAALPTT